MSGYFFDSSAIVKYYVEEPGSDWTRDLIDEWNGSEDAPANQISISQITIVEVPAAIAILHRRDFITRRVRDRVVNAFLNDVTSIYKVTPLSLTVLLHAARLTQKHPLKAYDATQLAIALALNALYISQNFALIFVSSDTQLLTAAKAEDLAIDNPHDHA